MSSPEESNARIIFAVFEKSREFLLEKEGETVKLSSLKIQRETSRVCLSICLFATILTFAIYLAAVLLISQRFQRLSATKAAEANVMIRRSRGNLKKESITL